MPLVLLCKQHVTTYYTQTFLNIAEEQNSNLQKQLQVQGFGRCLGYYYYCIILRREILSKSSTTPISLRYTPASTLQLKMFPHTQMPFFPCWKYSAILA